MKLKAWNLIQNSAVRCHKSGTQNFGCFYWFLILDIKLQITIATTLQTMIATNTQKEAK